MVEGGPRKKDVDIRKNINSSNISNVRNQGGMQIGENENHKGTIRILLVNTRSIKGKQTKFWTMVEIYDADVVIAVETWLDESIKDGEVGHDGYNIFRRDRNNRGGGILVACKEEMKGRLIWSDEDSELMGIKILGGSNEKEIIAVYRPPGNGESKVLNILKDRLKGDRGLIIAGDLNLPRIHWDGGSETSGSKEQQIVNTLINEGMTQVVSGMTRDNNNGGSLLDVVLVRPEDIWCSSEVVEGISDHRAVLVVVEGGERRVDKERGSMISWKYGSADKDRVREYLREKYASWKVKDGNID